MRRPPGVTIIAVIFCLLGIYLCGKSLFPFASGISYYLSGRSDPDLHAREAFGLWEVMVALPFVFGAVLLSTGWGLFRLHNWARFTAMLVLVVTAGAELPQLVIGVSHGFGLAFAGLLEFFLHLKIVWYLFKQSTAEKFLQSVKVV